MAVLVLAVLILAITGHSSATWCVCKDGVGDTVMQKALDYACGAGADCGPIHSNGACYQPNTVKAHCNYAVNSYFQRKGQAQGSCEFAGAAAISTTDPSTTGCSYPASLSAAGSGTSTPTTTPVTTTPSTTAPGTTTPSTTTPTTTSPYSATPTGVLGGINNGVGPSGAGINTDITDGGFRLQCPIFFALSITLLFSGLMLW